MSNAERLTSVVDPKANDARAQVDPKGNYLGDLLYADDALLIGSNATDVERYFAEVAKSGAEYGLQLHMGQVPAFVGRQGILHLRS